MTKSATETTSQVHVKTQKTPIIATDAGDRLSEKHKRVRRKIRSLLKYNKTALI